MITSLGSRLIPSIPCCASTLASPSAETQALEILDHWTTALQWAGQELTPSYIDKYASDATRRLLPKFVYPTEEPHYVLKPHLIDRSNTDRENILKHIAKNLKAADLLALRNDAINLPMILVALGQVEQADRLSGVLKQKFPNGGGLVLSPQESLKQQFHPKRLTLRELHVSALASDLEDQFAHHDHNAVDILMIGGNMEPNKERFETLIRLFSPALLLTRSDNPEQNGFIARIHNTLLAILGPAKSSYGLLRFFPLSRSFRVAIHATENGECTLREQTISSQEESRHYKG